MSDSLRSAERIRAIRRSGLLERAGSEQFGKLTEHVRVALRVPVAIISIVDEDRQVFAGHCGLPEPWASKGQTPISHSFCQHVVETNEPFIVQNANVHELVMQNDAIADLGVVAYIGVPISMPSGELVGALAAIDTKPREWTDHDLKTLESLACIVEQEIAVGLSELKYRSLFADMQEGYYIASAIRDASGELKDIVFEEINPAFEQLTGLTPHRVIGSTLSDLVPQALNDMLPAYDRVLKTGDFVIHANNATALGGRWYENRIRRLDSDRVASIFSDVTERKSAEAEQDIITREMSHRLKNMLAMVQAIATQTLRPVTERAYVDDFLKRLQALSSAHDILLDQNRDEAPISSVISATLQRIAPSGRLDLQGPDTVVGPKGTLSLSLVLHELGTNAVKYGAFANDTGRVSVTWGIDGTQEDAMFTLIWRESGGPPVAMPTRKGFGSKLIRMGLIGTGDVDVDYAPTGFTAKMTASLAQLQHTE